MRPPVLVIVNGDDFGKTPQVNEAIVRAFQAGTLTSCSLMVTGEAFEHAVNLAAKHRGLAVGIHLVTVQGKAVLPPSEIPHLVDGRGNFSDDPALAGFKYYFSSPAREQLKKELSAQFHRFRSTGLELSHVDSHLHMHVHPVIFAAALELAQEHQVKRMRLPHDDFRLALQYRKQGVAAKAAIAFIFGLLTRRMKRELIHRGFSFADRVYGHFFSGAMTLEYALYVLEHLSARTNELYFHPSVDDRPAGAPFPRSQGAGELDILTDSAFKKRLHDPGLALINYSGLATNQ